LYNVVVVRRNRADDAFPFFLQTPRVAKNVLVERR
jgi:hypothetical protein